MTDEWTLLQAARELGSWKPKAGSKYTFEEYEIGLAGTWVPTVDIEWLLGFKWTCPCNRQKRIKMFARVKSTVDQLKNKPDWSPRMRPGLNLDHGLIKTAGGK